MAAVLGIDAAWTAKNPSGVALLSGTLGNWRCAGIAPSYSSFIALARGQAVDWSERPRGEAPEIDALIAAARDLAGGERPSVVAVDMPLATTPITGRRIADHLTSQAFGRFKCAVHSPTRTRPGVMATRVMTALSGSGYPLATISRKVGDAPATIEVYPHATIVRLMNLTERLKYKVARSGKLWPGATVASRIFNVLAAFGDLKAMIEEKVGTVPLPIPGSRSVTSLASLKTLEDTLDALVCARAGAAYLSGNAEAFGNDKAAIWVPHAD